VTSLLAFYQQHAISPVRQHVTDLDAHFARRAGLYRALGLPPFSIHGRTVLEIGPGSGDNALYTASLKPARYVLLEPNPTGAADLRKKWPYTRSGSERYEIVEQRIEDYDPAQQFDVVLCEGLLGLCGTDPRRLLDTVACHVKPGGVLVITCIDPISDHAEILRRAMAQRLIDRSAPLADQVATLRPVFVPHLATLNGMTRSVDDWIVDNLLNPASIGPTFSIPDACEALEGRFDVLGCSPRFLLDWRWYKDAPRGNLWAIDSYWAQCHNLQDYRTVSPPHFPVVNRRLMSICLAFRQQLQDAEAGDGEFPYVEPIDPGWFGRGQQYLSFVRT
jgi:SAM-dependent methyltransferase